MHTSNLIGENRLLHYKVQTILEQQKKAGINPTIVGTPTTYTGASVTAGANAARQAQVYQATLAANQKEAGLKPITGSTNPGYITVSTPGGDIGYDASVYAPVLDENGNVVGVQQNTKNTTANPPKNAPAGWVDTSNLKPYSGEGHGGVAESPQLFEQRKAAIEQRNAALLQQQQIKQQAAQQAADRSAAVGAASAAAAGSVVNPVTGQSYSGAAGQRLQGRLDRADFIEKKRAEGLTDAQIRAEMSKLPPDAPTEPSPSAPTSPTPAPAPAPTPTPTTDSTEPTKAPGTTPPASNPADPSAPPAPSPTDSAYAALIAGTTDPQLKAVLQAMQAEDALTGALPPGQEMSRTEFNQSADAKAISSPYDAIQSIIDKAERRLETGEAAMKGFLKNQYERNDKFNAQQQENIQNQLQFANDKAVRDQADANKKMLDSQTIMLALQGGFGSTDGNREIAEARLKGEEAIINLNKEFGFKKTDVSLQFTQMHNEAYDKYFMAWQQATDNFESRLSDLDIQGISNQSAKASAISSAYKDYVTEIKDARKESAKRLTDATKMVYDAMVAERKAGQKDQMSTKDKLGFVQSLRSGIGTNKTITQAKDVDGFYGALTAGYNRYAQITKDIAEGKIDPSKGEAALGPSQSAVIGSLARILDPGSVVRNEEYERQTLGASFVNKVQGYWEKLQAGGAGITATDINEMKILADKLHESWEGRLQQEMLPFILDIQDWNASYPDAPIDFAQVVPVDRIHLAQSTLKTWSSQTGWETPQDMGQGGPPLQGFNASGGPKNGWRTDRHNNPIAFAVAAGGTNEFTKALDNAGIAWEHGDPFPESASMVTVRVLGDPVEASRVVLAETGALQNWYLQPKRPYANALRKFGIKSNQEFKALPRETQNEIIVEIYKGEVGNGSLVAGINGSDDTDSSVAHAADYDGIHFNDAGIEDDPIKIDYTMFTDPEKYARKEFYRAAGRKYGEYTQEFANTVKDIGKVGKHLVKKVSKEIADVAVPFAEGFSSQ